MKKLIMLFILLLTIAAPAAAQLEGDGRRDPLPGDRIAVYCKTLAVEVWGVTNNSTGVFLGRFGYTDLFAPGALTVTGDNGQIIADGLSSGLISVQWIGGPYFASGSGDFAKRINCNVAIALPSTGSIIPSTTTTIPVAQPVSTSSSIAQFGSGTSTTVVVEANITNSPGAVINQSVSVNTDNLACGSRLYTIQHGDTLYRLGLRFGTNVQTLTYCNNILNPSRIYVGQVIVVP